MKRDTDKQIDDLFKNGLSDPQQHVAYREEDWDALEQRLNTAERNKILPLWLPMSAAAIVLVALGWWLFAPMTIKQEQQLQTAAARPDKFPVGEPANSKDETKVAPSTQMGSGQTAVRSKLMAYSGLAKSTMNSLLPVGAIDRNKASVNSEPDVQQTAGSVNKDSVAADQRAGIVEERSTILAEASRSNALVEGNAKVSIVDTISVGSTVTVGSVTEGKAKQIGPSSSLRPQFTLSFMGAPEVNGLGAMLDVESGVNVGMIFSATVKRFSLSTGAAYSVKRYGSSYDDWGYMSVARGYSQASVHTSVIDIPLNLDYQLYNRYQNKLSAGVGFSSYIMFGQSYRYDYRDPDFDATVLTVPGADRYFMSTLNIQATYTRQVTPKFGLSLQPYFKLPLKEIGDSRSKLQTAGVAIGVNWYLNSFKK